MPRQENSHPELTVLFSVSAHYLRTDESFNRHPHGENLDSSGRVVEGKSILIEIREVALCLTFGELELPHPS